ncbi:MAG TPA: hypothetical protein VKK81_16220 [Candidatus Binatia bacterium]|nr:hypothetical protein [Candidatus Binatia bacterium]
MKKLAGLSPILLGVFVAMARLSAKKRVPLVLGLSVMVMDLLTLWSTEKP